MEKRKTSQKAIKVLISLIVVMVLALSAITLAWFTSSASFNSSITFGEILLDTESANSTGLTKTVTRNIGAYIEDGNVMPGDTINFALKIKLTDTSEPAYYLVKVAGEGALSSLTVDGYYYVDSNSALQTATSSAKNVGEITTAAAVTINIPFVISTEFTTQGVTGNITCTVAAIQQANVGYSNDYASLTTEQKLAARYAAAYDILDNMLNPPPEPTITQSALAPYLYKWDSENSRPFYSLDYDEIGFYYTNALPSGYNIDNAKTTALQSELAPEDEGYISVYTNGTKLAFVSDYTIYAPVNSSGLFRHFGIRAIVFNNFNTSKVTNMSRMFSVYNDDYPVEDNLLQSLDISSFDTSNVTDMSGMFRMGSSGPGSLRSLNLGNFNTDNVSNMTDFLYWVPYGIEIICTNEASKTRIIANSAVGDDRQPLTNANFVAG